MKISLEHILVKDLVNGFNDNGENGVYGFGGQLNIRPKYQREFIYDIPQQQAVIDTILKGYPLNVMYWVKNSNGTFELLDGQQRTMSICNFYACKTSILLNERTYNFDTFTKYKDLYEKFMNYQLTIYICEGEDTERLEWFRTINISGEKLTEQELLNATYCGSFVENAKFFFSREKGRINGLNKKFCLMNGKINRQDFLEIGLEWIAFGKKCNISEYMAQHQNDENADELYNYVENIFLWVASIFPKYRKEMKGLNWGVLYDTYKSIHYDVDEMEKEVNRLMSDDDVTNKKGIFEYLLSNKSADKERLLSIRAFTDTQKRTAYEKQKGICPICKKEYVIEDMQGDHILEWSKGGKTTMDNLQMVCKSCHKELTRRM